MIVRRAGMLAKQNDCALPSRGSAIPSFNQAGKGQISRIVKLSWQSNALFDV